MHLWPTERQWVAGLRAETWRQGTLVWIRALPPSICAASHRASFFLSSLLCKLRIIRLVSSEVFCCCFFFVLNRAIPAKHLVSCFTHSKNYIGVRNYYWIHFAISPSRKANHLKRWIKTECQYSITCISKIHLFLFPFLQSKVQISRYPGFLVPDNSSHI